MDPIAVVSRPDPSPRSRKWLDLDRLRDDIERLTIRQCLDKRKLNRILGSKSANDLAAYSGDPSTVSADDRWMAHESVDYNASRLTLLCAIRALHRNRKHVLRQRVFGPGYPNGTAIVNRPVRIPEALLNSYRLKARG